MRSFRALSNCLFGSSSRTVRTLMSSDSSKRPRPDVHKLLNGTTSLDVEADSERFASSAYHVDPKTLKKLEAELNERSQIDPRDTSVILFPGQGAQYMGMAATLTKVPGVKEMYEYASSMMKLDLLKLCSEGPERLLNMTSNCQAAMLVTSLAALEKLKYENPRAIDTCVVTAGFSVGEYAALVFAGVLTFEEAVQIVKLRGEAMQSCSFERQSGLLTVFTTPETNINYAMKLAREWCEQEEGIDDPVCEIANYLFPDCKVVGGDSKALNFLARNARDFGIRRVKRLSVSGAFHTKLMQPAKVVVKRALEQVDLKSPELPVVFNVSATAPRVPETIRKNLIEQVFMPVKWEQTMHFIYERDQNAQFPNTYEVGPGNTLRPVLKAVNKKAYSHSLKVEM